MTQYRKKPVVITAITFAELVAHGVDQLKALGRESNIVNGMPWAFMYAGHPITHESDTCYIIPAPGGNVLMGPDDMLITGVAGEIYPCKRTIFDATYEAAPLAQASTLPPDQQRVLAEKMDRDQEITHLDAFIRESAVFPTLADAEQARLRRQLDVMHELSAILGERIAAF